MRIDIALLTARIVSTGLGEPSNWSQGISGPMERSSAPLPSAKRRRTADCD